MPKGLEDERATRLRARSRHRQLGLLENRSPLLDRWNSTLGGEQDTSPQKERGRQTTPSSQRTDSNLSEAESQDPILPTYIPTLNGLIDLKIQLQGHLYRARQVCLAKNRPEAGRAGLPDARIGPGELRVIEGVEPFRTEFEVRAFANPLQGKLLEERQVRVRRAGNVDPRQGSRRTSYSVCGRHLEHLRIGKVPATLIQREEPLGLRVEPRRSLQVRPLAIVKSPDAGGLPASDNRVKHRIHVCAKGLPAAKGQLVNVAELEDLRDVVLRDPPVQLPVIGIDGADGREPVTGTRSLVNRFRPHVGSQDLEAIREALLKPQLQCLIARIGPRCPLEIYPAELRIGESELVLRYRRREEETLLYNALTGARLVKGIGDLCSHHLVPRRVSDMLLLFRTQMINIEIAGVAIVQMRSLFADIIRLEEHIPRQLALNSETPRLLIGRMVHCSKIIYGLTGGNIGQQS